MDSIMTRSPASLTVKSIHTYRLDVAPNRALYCVKGWVALQGQSI